MLLGGGINVHYLKDKEKYMELLREQSWDTPVKQLTCKAIKEKYRFFSFGDAMFIYDE